MIMSDSEMRRNGGAGELRAFSIHSRKSGVSGCPRPQVLPTYFEYGRDSSLSSRSGGVGSPPGQPRTQE